jgi:hypothetical protein
MNPNYQQVAAKADCGSGASITFANRAQIQLPSKVFTTAQNPGLLRLAGSVEISTHSVASRLPIQKLASIFSMFNATANARLRCNKFKCAHSGRMR